ncbi:MAG: transcriptional regulator NrdR [Candidatus Gracilibacteria bacterium]|nr:transcriptional regulator NrdR [Candidatus Gracilibacteria bacterium]
MICPKCHKNSTRVLDSRETEGHRSIRRRRECEICQHRFTTFERVDVSGFIVVKKDGSREAYDRQKVVKGIWKSCEKRKITQDQVQALVNDLEEKWVRFGTELASVQIGEDVMNALKDLDEVAYIRFASVYRQFKDIESFKKALEILENENKIEDADTQLE